MSSTANSIKRTRSEDLIVSPGDRPGWLAASARALRVGEEVFCAGGDGVVTALLGKTSDGSRLLQIQLADPAAKPFFAAASNVLVAPEAA
ncbi:MAG TPA: hypothetical protein VFR81_02780 [Longimicrobium sp.]|nr:hypothetical protein [Longimicrobium sp.]